MSAESFDRHWHVGEVYPESRQFPTISLAHLRFGADGDVSFTSDDNIEMAIKGSLEASLNHSLPNLVAPSNRDNCGQQMSSEYTWRKTRSILLPVPFSLEEYREQLE
jgi:hypothetical protein